MKRWLIGLVLFAFAGCGGDDPPPTGPVPNQRSIKLEITWPLATHPSMDTPQYWESQGSSCSGQWHCPGGGLPLLHLRFRRSGSDKLYELVHFG